MPTADEIRLALSLYGTDYTVSVEPHVEDGTVRPEPPVNRAIEGLLRAGLLDEVKPCTYEGNEALTMWVEALACVPFPVQRWVIPRYRLPSWDED